MLRGECARRTQELAAHLSQLHLRRVCEQLLAVLHLVDGHLAALGKVLDCVGEVDLALGVVATTRLQRLHERVGVEAIEGGVHPWRLRDLLRGERAPAETDRTLILQCLLHIRELDDAQRAPVLDYHMSAIWMLLPRLHPANSNSFTPSQQLLYDARRDDLVPHRHDDGAGEADVGEGAQSAHGGVAGALLLLLIGIDEAGLAVEG